MAGNRHPLLLLEMGKECGNMPTIDITMRKGCSDQAIENCLLQIPQAAEDILENTKKRMLRVSVFEAEPEMNFENGEAVEDKINPSVVFTIGPGRSTEAKQKISAVKRKKYASIFYPVKETILPLADGRKYSRSCRKRKRRKSKCLYLQRFSTRKEKIRNMAII